MEQIANQKDRHEIIRLIALFVCFIELFILFATLIYQKDRVIYTETPLSHEMAQEYIDHPEKLAPGERLALNLYDNRKNGHTYLLIRESEKVIPFPWKAWILISAGAPIGLVFLILIISRAYFQAVKQEDEEKRCAAENPGKVITALNSLGQINVLWFLLISFVTLFLIWYVPKILKATGEAAMAWMTRYWYIPATLFFSGIGIFLFWMYLHYRLKVRAMKMEMELAKFKLIQLEHKAPVMIENKDEPPIHIFEKHLADDKPGSRDVPGNG